MAKKAEVAVKKVKKINKQKILVAKGRVMGSPEIPYEVILTEIVPSKDAAAAREKELREEYKDVDGLSVSYFSM